MDVPKSYAKSYAKWVENDRLGYWNGDTPEYLMFYRVTDNGDLTIPRGFTRQLIQLCKRFNVAYQLTDDRLTLSEIKLTFNGQLKPFQKEAVNAILIRDFGTLSAPTGSGKTVMALNVIAQRKQPTLIVVHTKELLNQWIDRVETFLQIPANEIAVIGNGQKQIGKTITVALIQSLYKCANEIRPHIGYLIVDECHRTPSRTFTEGVTAFDCKYMLGLRATPWRRDKLSRLIFWHLGDVVHEIKKQTLVETGDVLPAEVIVRETTFQTRYNASEEYSRMLSELTEDPQRNSLIVQDVAAEASNGGGISLVLSDRKAHCNQLSKILERGSGITSAVLTGDLPKKQREEIVEALNAGTIKVLIATGQLIGEGFDLKELSTLFLATPIKFNGRVIQYLGRVLRTAPGKDKARVFDYVDSRIGVLRAGARGRLSVYG